MRNRFTSLYVPVLAAFALLALAACGGGGSSGGGGTIPSPGGGNPNPQPSATAAPTTAPTQAPAAISTAPPNATSLGAAILTAGTVRPVNGGDNNFTPNDGNTASGGQGAAVDNIPCLTTMPDNQYHRHLWLGFLVQGKEVAMPDAMGMVGFGPDDQNGFTNSAQCFYYIHTHDSSGYIHIEPDSTEQYTLKNLFDIWGQPFVGGANGKVGPFTGPIRVFTAQAPTGSLIASAWQEVTTDPNAIPLNTHHMAIMIEVGPTWVEANALPPVHFYTEN